MAAIDVWSVTCPPAKRTCRHLQLQMQAALVSMYTSGHDQHLHLSLIVTDKRAAVVLDDGRQLRSRELAVRHPARQLVVPDAVVTTEELAVCLGKVCDLVAAGESEGTFRGFGSILTTCPLAMLTIFGTEKAHCYPFHAVPRGDLAKLLGVIQFCGISRVGELGVVRRRPKVELPGGLCERVQACSRDRGDHGGRCRR